ncbi:MAG: alpha/beta hydrolase [bacterium]|nr:alpha/beta hydrolase [bacterium]
MTASSSSACESFTSRDGFQIAYSSSGDAGPLVVFVHATGFCKELCDPVISDTRELAPEFRALAVDQRAHGDSAAPDPPFDWWDVGADVVELIAGRRPVIGVGHSAGGAALALAELANPGTFATLVLVEPIIFPPPYGRFQHNPMSAGALRRRPAFPSRKIAYDNFRSKPAFAGWQDRAMRAYVDGGLREVDDGVVLKCSPQDEAEFFMAATEHGAWDRLGEIEVPALLLAGEHSTTHQEPFLAELAARFPDGSYTIIPDASHFVWMERPEAVAGRIAAVIDSLGEPGH